MERERLGETERLIGHRETGRRKRNKDQERNRERLTGRD